MCICSMFCATPQDVDEIYTRKEVMGGGTSRVILVTLEDEAGAKPALFRALTDDECQLVHSALDVIMQDTYTDEGQLQPVQMVPMEWLDYHVRRWCNDQRQLVLKTGSRARNCFYKRASVSAARMSCLLYYLWQTEGFKAAKPQVSRFKIQDSGSKTDLNPESAGRSMNPESAHLALPVSRRPAPQPPLQREQEHLQMLRVRCPRRPHRPGDEPPETRVSGGLQVACRRQRSLYPLFLQFREQFQSLLRQIVRLVWTFIRLRVEFGNISLLDGRIEICGSEITATSQP